MANFFDDFGDDEFDGGEGVSSTTNGGISNGAYLNDYRNRAPFHYIEDGKDGYYYWQYGATMEIEFLLDYEIAFSDIQLYPVEDILIGEDSVINPLNRVVILGDMSKENKEDYYTKLQVDLQIATETGRAVSIESSLLEEINTAKQKSETLESQITDLYNKLVSEQHIVGNN